MHTHLHSDCVYYEVIAVIYFEKVHLLCMHNSSLVCIFATEMALYNTCDVSPLSKDGSLHRMLTLDTETSSMLISTVVAVRTKAISKLSAMFCNHSCMAICFCLCILAVAHTLCSAWALGACGNPFLYITRTYIYNVFKENRIDYS